MKLEFLQDKFGRTFALLGSGGLLLLLTFDTVRLVLTPGVSAYFTSVLGLSSLFTFLLWYFIWRSKGLELRYHPLAIPAVSGVFAAFGVIGLGYLGLSLTAVWTLAFLTAGVIGMLALHQMLVPEGSGLAVE